MISPITFHPFYSDYSSARSRIPTCSSATCSSSRSGPIEVRLPGKNCIYSGGDGRGQSAYVEYTDDSTDSDPIVRISGHSLSGDYEKVVHLNDIDPSHASYPELCAWLGHQQRIGAYTPEHGMILGVPLGVDKGDYSQAQNFSQKIIDSIHHNLQYGNQKMANSGKYLLSLYQKILSKKTKELEEAPIDYLLDYIDRTRLYGDFQCYGRYPQNKWSVLEEKERQLDSGNLKSLII